jgi:hypothetical protein
MYIVNTGNLLCFLCVCVYIISWIIQLQERYNPHNSRGVSAYITYKNLHVLHIVYFAMYNNVVWYLLFADTLIALYQGKVHITAYR